MFCNCNNFKDVDCKMENKGKELTITLTGKQETLKTIEKKLKNLKELCCDDDSCCE